MLAREWTPAPYVVHDSTRTPRLRGPCQSRPLFVARLEALLVFALGAREGLALGSRRSREVLLLVKALLAARLGRALVLGALGWR